MIATETAKVNTRRASATQCPRDATPSEYLKHVRLAILDGRDPVPPHTIGQIEAMIEHYPERGRRYIPPAQDLKFLGLPATWGQPIEPFGTDWKQRFFATLEADPEFCRAVGLKLGVL